MQQKPLLSIIVPMYNRRRYIMECVNSIRQQTFADWELILVDDASTDGTPALCKAAFCGDRRIKVVMQAQNQGVSAARNRGLELAQGEYVTFVDSDDFLLADGLHHMMGIALAHQPDVIWSMGRYYKKAAQEELLPAPDEAGSMQDLAELSPDIGERVQLVYASSAWIGAVWNRMYRRQFLKENQLRFELLSANEDTLFNFLCLFHARKYMVTTKLYYVYRLSDDSILRQDKYLDHLTRHVQDTFKLSAILWRSLQAIPYFQQYPEAADKVMEKLSGYMLEMPQHWGFYPTPPEHRQTVADCVRNALAADFGDKAWLVQYLYRQFMESQGRGRT